MRHCRWPCGHTAHQPLRPSYLAAIGRPVSLDFASVCCRRNDVCDFAFRCPPCVGCLISVAAQTRPQSPSLFRAAVPSCHSLLRGDFAVSGSRFQGLLFLRLARTSTSIHAIPLETSPGLPSLLVCFIFPLSSCAAGPSPYPRRRCPVSLRAPSSAAATPPWLSRALGRLTAAA